MIKSICSIFIASLILSCNPSKQTSDTADSTVSTTKSTSPVDSRLKKEEHSMRSQVLETKEEIKEGDFKVAYLASGCFWCVEAIYESVNGVQEVISGYAEGLEENANYRMVSSGKSNHVEAVKIIYDPAVVSFKTLMTVFFGSGDPTTLNQQGPDKGYQYRSAIYFQNNEEKLTAEGMKQNLESAGVFEDPIVTDILSFTTFFDAEDYHQDYEKKNPNQPYVKAVSVPRLNRFKAAFPQLLK